MYDPFFDVMSVKSFHYLHDFGPIGGR